MYIHDLIISEKELPALEHVVLSKENKDILEQCIKEYKYNEILSEYNLPIANKILFEGASGCGKTMVAKAIANELNKPIHIINLSNIINSRIGETSQNLKQIFEKAGREKSILFLDEIDQIAKARSTDDQDVGEMRRIVNTIIQLMDYFPSKALLIGATNFINLLDGAILRRFQEKLKFELPTHTQLNDYYESLLKDFPKEFINIDRLYNISFAEAKDLAFSQVKKNIIDHYEETTKMASHN